MKSRLGIFRSFYVLTFVLVCRISTGAAIITVTNNSPIRSAVGQDTVGSLGWAIRTAVLDDTIRVDLEVGSDTIKSENSKFNNFLGPLRQSRRGQMSEIRSQKKLTFNVSLVIIAS